MPRPGTGPAGALGPPLSGVGSRLREELIGADILILSPKQGKRGSASQLSLQVEGGKRMLGNPSPQLQVVFETGADLSFVEDEKLLGREKSPDQNNTGQLNIYKLIFNDDVLHSIIYFQCDHRRKQKSIFLKEK